MVGTRRVENRRSASTMEAMATAHPTPGRAEPVERFRPTSGQVTGYGSLVAIGVLLVYVALDERTLTGLRIATGAVFFGVLLWVTVLRPRVTAYPDVLHMQNSVRDVLVPWTSIDEVNLGRVLSVWVGGERHVCTGIGASLRRRTPPASRPDQPGGEHHVDHGEYVADRIRTLVQEAHRRAAREGGTTDERPRRVWAVPELLALVGTGLSFLLTLVL